MASFEKQDTRDAVISIIKEKLSVDEKTVNLTESATFQDLGADSLDMVEMTMKLEERFGIEINDADAEKLTTVGSVIDYVHSLRSK